MFWKREKKMKAQEIFQENFDEAVKSKKIVFVYFEAPWCSACKMLHPLLHELAHENREKDFLLAVVNVDTNRELAQKYHIMSIPQLLVFQDGKLVFQGSGMISKPRTQEMIEKYFLSD